MDSLLAKSIFLSYTVSESMHEIKHVDAQVKNPINLSIQK